MKKTEFIYFRGPGFQVPLQDELKIGREKIKQVDGVKFLGVWVDEGLKWTPHISRVKTKVGQLLGVIGRAAPVLQGRGLLSLYNGIVLPHLQYCLMVWGDFRGGRNMTIGDALLRYQKRFAGLIAGKRGLYHATPLFGKHGILKIEDIYRQQLRIHGWRFLNGRLPDSQADMLGRVSNVHSHATRSATHDLYSGGRDHNSISYRVPKEWSGLTKGLKEQRSLTAFKRQSKTEFLTGYKAFSCGVTGCRVCGGNPG